MIKLWRSLMAFSRQNRKEFERFGKFCVVGVIGTVVDFSILNLGVQVLLLPLLIANAFSFSTAVVSNFTWNRLWTYPESRQQRLWPQLGQFVLVNVAGLGINEGILATLNQPVTALWGKWGYNIAKIAATAVVLFWNFGINRIWTYKEIR